MIQIVLQNDNSGYCIKTLFLYILSYQENIQIEISRKQLSTQDWKESLAYRVSKM